eukprot:6900123-Ditylum_brightwellii.AAC.1
MVLHNLLNSVLKNDCPKIMMCDEMNCNQQIDVGTKINAVLGICYQYSQDITLEFRTTNDINDIKEALDEGVIHVTKEALL